MKDIITFLAVMIFYYLIIVFISSNPYILAWHWGVKLVYVVLGLITMSNLFKK
jgi:hypothetical protein